jgi:hypothetical protein
VRHLSLYLHVAQLESQSEHFGEAALLASGYFSGRQVVGAHLNGLLKSLPTDYPAIQDVHLSATLQVLHPSIHFVIVDPTK